MTKRFTFVKKLGITLGLLAASVTAGTAITTSTALAADATMNRPSQPSMPCPPFCGAPQRTATWLALANWQPASAELSSTVRPTTAELSAQEGAAAESLLMIK